MNELSCTCGHAEREHRWPSKDPRNYGWTQGGCRIDLCACKVFERDRDYIRPSKALTPREKRDRLTRDGAAWLTDNVVGVGRFRLELEKEIGCSESMARRIRRAIEYAAPFTEGATLERLKGGDLGPKAWRLLLAWLRKREFVFGDDKPCPTCGRMGA